MGFRLQDLLHSEPPRRTVKEVRCRHRTSLERGDPLSMRLGWLIDVTTELLRSMPLVVRCRHGRSCLQPLMCVNRLTFQDLDMCHGGSRVCNVFYQFEASLSQRDDAHSIVPGGFDVMS